MKSIEIRKTVRELQGTWAEIAEAIKSGAEFNMGDYKVDRTLDGQEFTMVVTDVTDKFVRFESQNCVGKAVQWSRSNDPCYFASHIQNYLEEELFEQLPEELREVISLARRKTMYNGKVITIRVPLFLPTASEVFSKGECYGDEGLYEQMAYYKDQAHRMRYLKETEEIKDMWWLASIDSEAPTTVCCVSGSGNPKRMIDPTLAMSVPVCFVINKF